MENIETVENTESNTNTKDKEIDKRFEIKFDETPEDIKDIERIIDIAKTYKLESPVCIPSYKFRDDSWLVHNLDKIDAPVYLFVYEDDYTASNYDKFNWSNNVTIVKIKEEDFKRYNLRWRGIQPKRKYIQLYMNNLGIEKYFMIDDDLHNTFTAFNNKLERITANLLLNIIEIISNENPSFSVLGVNKGIVNRYFSGISENKAIIRLYYFNKNQILFTDEELNEDLDFYVENIKQNTNYGVIDFLTATYNNENPKQSSISDPVDLYRKTCKKYPELFKIEKRNNREYIVFNYKDAKAIKDKFNGVTSNKDTSN